jgi:5,5'-dehydrodivanillate O-demethylase oxygenase subunit
VLDQQENELLTRIGPGTPAGELLRRYWQPVCYASDLTADDPSRSIKIMDEELVVFRFPDGSYGCMEEHCAHRRTSLAYGFVERDGIRCPYHGWKYDRSGQCVEQPFEPEGSTFKERIRLKAYPAQALSGLVFVYMGPLPAPVFPRWDFLVWTDGRRELRRQPALTCNWLQIQENTADYVHTYFLHGHMLYTTGHRDAPSMRLYRPFERYCFQPFEWGQVKAWQYAETDTWPSAKEAGAMLIMPNILRFAYDMHWRVPIDDTHTLVFAVSYKPGEPAPADEQTSPRLIEDDPHYLPDGRYGRDHIWAQDRLAWETQGPILERRKEHLGTSDRGVILFRQMLKEQIELVQKGKDPMNVLRQPRDIIELPLDQYVKPRAGKAKDMRMWDYFDERQEWFDVPDGPARQPGFTR